MLKASKQKSEIIVKERDNGSNRDTGSDDDFERHGAGGGGDQEVHRERGGPARNRRPARAGGSGRVLRLPVQPDHGGGVRANDHVITSNGVRMFVDMFSAQYLNGVEI